jgi:uncharacterized protein
MSVQSVPVAARLVSGHRETFVSFRSQGEELAGILHDAQGEASRLGVLIIVGGPQYRVGSHRQFVLMARAWAAAGHPVLRVDFQGMGDSSGTARGFDASDADVRAAIDAFFREVPALRGVALFGLCDAASAALIYCNAEDARLKGLILANPWVRTQAGEARAYVRHYYWQRLLQPSLWHKVFTGKFQARDSLRSFFEKWRTAARGAQPSEPASQTHFVTRMHRGLVRFAKPVLIFVSERDLTAGEFMDLCRDAKEWRKASSRANVHVQRLPGADHTFSARESLDSATSQSLRYLKEWDAV